MNWLIFLSNVMDPQYKLDYLRFSLIAIYGDLIGGNLFTNVKAALYELYDDYVNDDKSVNALNNALTVTSGESQCTSIPDVQSSGQSFSVLKARFK